MVGLLSSLISIRKHEQVFEGVSTIGCIISALFPQRCQASVHRPGSGSLVSAHSATAGDTLTSPEKRTCNAREQESREENQSEGYLQCMGFCVE